MNILTMYEKVNLICPIDQRDFFHYLNSSASELDSMYGDVKKLVFVKDGFRPFSCLHDEITILPLYHDAIVDNILFLAGQGAEHKTEFIRKAENAYLTYWNKNAKGRCMKKKEW